MGFRFFHTLLWLGGLFFGIVPMLWQHSFGSTGAVASFEDSLGTGTVVMLGLAALGSFLWGVLARFINVDTPKRGRQQKRWFWLAIGIQALICYLGMLEVLTGYAYYLTGVVACIVIAWLVYLVNGVSDALWPQVKSFLHWLVKRNSWNGLFYFAIFAFLLWHNSLLVFDIKPGGVGFYTSLLINRVFNQLAIVAMLYLVIQFTIVAAPKWSQLLVWLVSSLIPVAIFADQLLMGMWNTNLVNFLNSFGVDGLKNIETELKGGGVPMSLFTLLFSFIGALATLTGIIYLLHFFSRKLKLRVSPLTMVIVVALAVLAATLEQNIGKSWKQRKQVIAEASEFDIQIGLSSKLEPLAGFDVKFRDHHFEPAEMQTKAAKRPNVFIILVESFREDALTAENTPFLYQFKQTEAQPIERGWASSNGTHLSWFGIFSGRVPIHWEDDKVRCKQEQWPGLNAFHAWRGAGYELQIYAPGELGYRQMGEHFFGAPGKLFGLVRDNNEQDPIFNKDLSERERLLLEDFKKDLSRRVSTSVSGKVEGLFSMFCIDSSHFYYQWHQGFTPPFKDYYDGKWLPSRPNAQELQLVKNKYFNALAWSDYLVEQYCAHLKHLGLYDDSIVIVMGDHGEEFQDNGGWLHVSSLEDEQVRVPILIKWPKNSRLANSGRGPAVKDASQLDVLPSLLDYIYGARVDTLAGESLLSGKDHGVIATTAQSGKLQEGMMLAKGGYKAYFKWPNYWDGRPTERIYLSRFTGPDGDIGADGPEQYEKMLREHFGEALEKAFQSFKLVSE